MNIAILLFDDFTALDAVGPYEVLNRIPGATVQFVAERRGEHRTDVGSLGVTADHTLDEVSHPDIVLVPGGPGEAAAGRRPAVLGWLRAAHVTSTWTTSVCTGSLVLGAAGLLDGVRATSHWTALDALAATGAVVTDQRVVIDGKVATAAGVSAGIDLALTLAARIAGDDVAEAIQLGIEYDPQPPFDRGSVAKARPEILAFMRERSRFERSPSASA